MVLPPSGYIAQCFRTRNARTGESFTGVHSLEPYYGHSMITELKRHFPLAVAAAGILFATGCERDESPTTPSTGHQAEHPSNTLRHSDFDNDPDRPAEWFSTALAREIPGFGGFSFDSVGNISVYITNLPNRPAVQAVRDALTPILTEWEPVRDMRPAANPEVLILPGDYTFFQLRTWRDKSVDDLLFAGGATFVNLSESRNRLAVGIDPLRPAEAQAHAEQILQQHGIPREAVVFVERGPPLFGAERLPEDSATSDAGALQATCSSLTSECRPLLAGTQLGIDLSWTTPGRCTLGPTIYYRDRPHFLTAAHCTDRIAHIDDDLFGQPYPVFHGSDPYYVGWEWWDPPFATYPFDTRYGRCVEDVNCRRSDMVLARTHVNLGFGFVARTAGYGATGAGNPGSTQIVGSWSITGEHGGSPFNGQLLEKVGVNTGWTYGPVLDTCTDIRYEGISTADPNKNVVLRCQHFVENAYADEGDSGGPVFRLIDGHSGSRIELHGIQISADRFGDGFYYTSMDMIRLDLGMPIDDYFTLRTH